MHDYPIRTFAFTGYLEAIQLVATVVAWVVDKSSSVLAYVFLGQPQRAGKRCVGYLRMQTADVQDANRETASNSPHTRS